MDPIKILKASITKQSGAAIANELGVSPAYLSDVINGRREPGPKILEPLGLERVVTYRRIRK